MTLLSSGLLVESTSRVSYSDCDRHWIEQLDEMDKTMFREEAKEVLSTITAHITTTSSSS